MFNAGVRSRRLTDAATAFMLIAALLAPVFYPRAAAAEQLTTRSITLGSSVAGATDVTYTVTFTQATYGAALEGIVIDFCSNSPIAGLTCTTPAGFDVNESGLAVSVTGMDGGTAFTKHANTDTNTLILTRTNATLQTATNNITVTLGAGGGSDGITNPSTACGGTPADKCTFYARIMTYVDDTAAAAYTSTSPGSYQDTGSVALSTANQLTITARVQEVLQFCVGTEDADSSNDCADITGTIIDLGVVDSSLVAASADGAGKAMVRTNAVNGVTIGYYAEQNAGSGQLKVAGASCAGGSSTDQCFNSAGTTAQAIVAGTEMFGMRANAVDTSNGTTTNLVRDAVYASADYAWDDSGSLDIIASSAGSGVKVVDDELVELKFAATAATTTPTGAYTVTATFIATATF